MKGAMKEMLTRPEQLISPSRFVKQIMPVLGRGSKRSIVEKQHVQTIYRLQEDTRKSVWYVFDTLSNISTGKVMKSQLKVLTSTIGQILNMDKTEESLNKENSTNDLYFHEYITVLEEEVFKKVTNSALEKLNLTDKDLEKVHRNCWILYLKVKKEPIVSTETLKALPEEVSYTLWRVYNFLAEEEENGMPVLPMQLHVEEAKHVMEAFVESTSQVTLLSKIDDAIKTYSTDDVMSFVQFETMFIQRFSKDLTDNVLTQASKELFEKFLSDTIIKGTLCKRGYNVKTWKDRWIVLKTKQVFYFTDSDQRECKGEIKLDQDCAVEVIPDASSKSGSRRNRFVLKTTAKPYELSAHDIKTRNDWMTALQRAIDNCSEENYHCHRHQAKERRRVRLEKLRQMEEVERRKREDEKSHQELLDQFNEKIISEEEQRRKHLDELEKARLNQLDLEGRLRAEEALRKQEQQRLRELEEIKRLLEQLLEEERQAQRDEEIVRALQARLLGEEMEKREELEQLRREQDELLKQERSRRESLEELQNEQARKLDEAASNLHALEAQRKAAEQEMAEAATKLHEAEKERIKLQHKVNLWKTPTIGLARPVQPRVEVTTHRGLGAFCKEDVVKHREDDKETEDATKAKNEDGMDTTNDDNGDETKEVRSDTEINENTKSADVNDNANSCEQIITNSDDGCH